MGERLTRLGGIAGMAAIVWFFVGLVFAAALRPGYSHVAQAGSDLGRGPHWWLFTGTLEGFALLLAVFAVALTRMLHGQSGSRRYRWARVAFAASALGAAMGGAFSEYRPGDKAVWHGLLHGLGFALLMTGAICGQLAVGPILRRLPGWRALGNWALFSAPFTAVLLIASFALPTVVPGIGGLLQRILLAVAFAWHAVAGYRLSRQSTVAARRGQEVDSLEMA